MTHESLGRSDRVSAGSLPCVCWFFLRLVTSHTFFLVHEQRPQQHSSSSSAHRASSSGGQGSCCCAAAAAVLLLLRPADGGLRILEGRELRH